MKISVVIPAYNHEKHIIETVNSVLTQTYGDFELIIINDGSTDRTEELILSINDKRIKYLYQQNQGAHAAINRGIEISSGKYVAILNSDDVYEKERLEKCFGFLENNTEYGAAITKALGINDNSLPVSPKDSAHVKAWMNWYSEALVLFANDAFLPNAYTKNILITTSNYFVKKGLFEKAGGFRPLRYAHDWDMLLKLSNATKIHLIDDSLLRYRIHDSNTVREKDSEARVRFEVNWLIADHIRHLYDTVESLHEISRILKNNHYLSVEVLMALLAYHDKDSYTSLLNFENRTTKRIMELL